MYHVIVRKDSLPKTDEMVDVIWAHQGTYFYSVHAQLASKPGYRADELIRKLGVLLKHLCIISGASLQAFYTLWSTLRHKAW